MIIMLCIITMSYSSGTLAVLGVHILAIKSESRCHSPTVNYNILGKEVGIPLAIYKQLLRV